MLCRLNRGDNCDFDLHPNHSCDYCDCDRDFKRCHNPSRYSPLSLPRWSPP
ncbi:hypothetical protein JHK85_001728 [Glycine max]|uniref:Uncharacterized protein n=1 Tax=Glycine soja TaxID=3848 RepID=A0A0B2SUJ1_GLYSO|nr:hypothetical protein JHK87_001677 [Glycine soja]KAG5069351.1 hypothetical protein JHK85_001728 [Glycine max]KAG5089076.1 hypothetical protein JHK86_001688 [Glycine max]KHN47912.1 hypothetical protein glysoja_031118 [Glycine soja]